MRLAPIGLAAALFSAAALPAIAQDLSDEVDLLLWCGSAFYVMSIAAESEEDAGTALVISEILTDYAAEILLETGLSEDEFGDLLAFYDERVEVDFREGTMPYEGDECLAALD